MKTKLGPKLLSLFDLVEQDYENIWDTCCDHGNLGLAFLESNKAHRVHFVDQVPSIMDSLQRRIDLIPRLEIDRYELHTEAAQAIVPSSKDLLCICGVGGEVVIDILKSLKPECDLLISPQYHLFEVRRFLDELGYKSINESLILEGKFGRELFYLSKNRGEKIDPIGRKIINNSEEHLVYLKGMITHLDKRSSTEALKLYKNLLNALLSSGITK